MKCTETKLPSSPKALRVINEQLWCCSNKSGIIVFDGELQQQRVIPRGSMGEIHDVAVLSNGDLVVATLYGLYHTDVAGNIINVHYKVTSEFHSIDLLCIFLYFVLLLSLQ